MTNQLSRIIPVTLAVCVLLSGCPRSAKVPESTGDTSAPAPADSRLLSGWSESRDNDIAEGEAGYRIVQEDTGIELVYVPGGSFTMGTDDGATDADPTHLVELSPFWIGRTEVTLEQWAAVMGWEPDPPTTGVDAKPNNPGDPSTYSHWEYDHSVVHVTWPRAEEFCDLTGLRLPTEAQWEYAARGPESLQYPWGDEWDPKRCIGSEGSPSRRGTEAVGSRPTGASWCGALDMAGNVSEMCRDWYDGHFYEKPEAAERDPECLDTSSGRRVARGGCWFDSDHFCCSSTRVSREPGEDSSRADYRVVDPYTGFRVAIDQ